MNVYEIQSWTFDFVERNETECADFVVSMQNDALTALKNGSYVKAAEMFRDIVRGMGILSAIDRDFYEPPYYAACLHLSKVEAFGLKNAKDARHYLEIACEHASSCAKPGRPTAMTAERDLKAMRAMLKEFEKGTPIPEIAEKFGIGTMYGMSNNSRTRRAKPRKTINGSGKFSNLELSTNMIRAGVIGIAVVILVIVAICFWPEEKPKTVSEIQDSRPEIQSEVVAQEENKAFVNAANGLNVRSEPDTNGNIIGRLSNGTTVIILEETDGWVKVEYGDGEGWCSKEYIKIENADSME